MSVVRTDVMKVKVCPGILNISCLVNVTAHSAWCNCDVTVVYLWCICGVIVVYLWCDCGVIVV